MPQTDKGVIAASSSVKCEVVLEISESDALHSEYVARPLISDTAKVKKKRGRKKKVASDVPTKTHDNFKSKVSNSQTKSNTFHMGKRKRKRKVDNDYEYNLSGSEDEAMKLETEYDDDRDTDYKVEKDTVCSDEEDIHTPDCRDPEPRKNKNKSLRTTPVKATTEVNNGECVDAATENPIKEEAENNIDSETGMDDVGVDFDDLSEFGEECEVDSDEDGEGTYSDTLAAGQDGSMNVLTVGINDLDTENDHAKRLKKYMARAKEKYHQEKVVNEDGKVIYRCLKCNEEFKMRLQLKEHRKVHSNKVKIYDCGHCDKVFTEARKYYSHLAFHDRLFECRLCGRKFSLLRNLKKHLTIHKGAPNQVCEICGSQFSTGEELKVHHETQHKEDSVKPYKIECEHCGRKYVREEAYQQHISKAPYKCSMCDASLGCEFKLKDHVRFQHGRCICEFCGKSFKKHSLLHHIKVIHKEGCVQCPHCPKKFAYRSKMLAHLDANHTKEKKYKCNHCSYTARTVNTLNIHRRKKHSEPGTMPSYACNQCGRTFSLPSKLTLHYRIHTGERPFKCRSCGKDFASKYNMVEHERCVHGEKVKLVHPDGTTSVRVVKHRRFPRAPGRRCDLCGLHLPSSSAVVAHMKQHHNAQAISSISLVADKEESDEIQVAEFELNRDNYEPPSEQFEVIENSEQDLILTAPTGMVTIPDYATHVEINGVEYQVLRQ